MKIYKVSKQTFSANYSTSTDTIGYYRDKSKAIAKAKKMRTDPYYSIVICYPNKRSSDGYNPLCTNLDGKEIGVPYNAYIITEINVK